MLPHIFRKNPQAALKIAKSAADRRAINELSANMTGTHGFSINTRGVSPEVMNAIKEQAQKHKRKIEPAKDDRSFWFIRQMIIRNYFSLNSPTISAMTSSIVTTPSVEPLWSTTIAMLLFLDLKTFRR